MLYTRENAVELPERITLRDQRSILTPHEEDREVTSQKLPPTESDQIRPNLTESDRIPLNPTESH